MKKIRALHLDRALKYHNDYLRRPVDKRVTKKMIARKIDTLKIPHKTKGEYLTLYSKGHRACPKIVAEEIAHILRVSVEYLWGLTDDPEIIPKQQFEPVG